MKKILLLTVILIEVMLLVSAPVDPRQAQKVALNFMQEVSSSVSERSECHLIYSKTNGQGELPLWYIFQIDSGFVIVSADDAVIPILGYATDNPFVVERIPDNCKAWLQQYADEIELVKSLRLEADETIRQRWIELTENRSSGLPDAPVNTNSVAPLLTTTWGQSPNYNALCPGSGSSKAVTGCVATAMAQIINYYEYPVVGYGTHSYTDPTYGVQSVDFSNTTYQYALMPNALNYGSNSTQINAVATLMYHCGVAVNMEYSPSGSGAYVYAARAAFVTHFGYHAHLAMKEYPSGGSYTTVYSDNAWKAMLKADLDLGRPIYYSGSGDAGGHAFVCDGYNANDYFHFNWGWGGYDDGYFTIGQLNPGGYDFSRSSRAIFVVPDPQALSSDLLNPTTPNQQVFLFNMEGVTTQTVADTVLIAHPRGLNNRLCGVSYGNVCSDQIILYPEQSEGQIRLEVLEHDWQDVDIYDGVGTEGNLLLTVNNSGQSTLSTTGALTLDFSGALYCDGFLLRASPVYTSVSTEFWATACDSYTWNSTTYTQSGDYEQEFQTVSGYDSTVTLHLIINPSFNTEFSATACDSYTWNGETYTQSGNYVQEFETIHGCDSTVTLHLTIYPSVNTEFSATVCDSYTWNGETYTQSGDYVQEFETIHGCDSTVTLHLTIYNSTNTDFSATACDSYSWNGETYTQSGNYIQEFETIHGCDSTVTLHLTIYNSAISEFSATACDSYSWNNEIYTQSGDYVQTFETIHGCDSIVTLYLTINHPVTSDIYDTACDSYTWNGETYTQSGDYVQTFEGFNGCDSTVTLHLTVHYSVTSEFSVTATDSYTWNGETYTESGDYVQVFETVFGCDSTVTLHLTITVGIDLFSDHNVVSIYPNPTLNVVYIHYDGWNSDVELQIQLFDMYGQHLKTIPFESETVSVDLSEYASGTYFFKIGDKETKTVTYRVIKL